MPKRVGKQCRERWQNQLRPTINKVRPLLPFPSNFFRGQQLSRSGLQGPWTADEEETLFAAQQELGNAWSAIVRSPHLTPDPDPQHHDVGAQAALGVWMRVQAKLLPGRTDNAIKKFQGGTEATIKCKAALMDMDELTSPWNRN